jgi:hypothetical protein
LDQQLNIFFNLLYHNTYFIIMSTSDIYPQIWDSTLAVGPALAKFVPKLIDIAISKGLPYSLDQFGCAYHVVSPADFLLRFGAHPQRRPAMALAAGNNVDLTNWRVNNEKKESQLQVEHYLRNLVLANVSDELQRSMQNEDGSMRARSAEYIITTLLETHGTLTKADIDLIMTRLKVPYTTSSDVVSFIADWHVLLRDLRRAGQPLSQHQAIDTLQQCFGAEFDDCWVKFVQDYPVVAARTVALLSVAIIAFAKDVLPIRATQRAIGINQVINQTAAVSQLQDQITELQQALAVERAARLAPGKKRGAPPAADIGVPPVRAARQRHNNNVALKDRLFCYTHGPCTHIGTAFQSPDIDHKEMATWANQMGSKWKQLFVRKGWPTA